MADFPAFQELFRVGRDEILTRNSSLTREVIEREGSDANAIVAGEAAVGDEVIGQLTKVAAGLYLDSAKGQDLDRLVFDRYGLTRKPASPAMGSVVFTTTAPAPGAFSIPLGTKLQAIDGEQFITTAAASFAAASTGPVTVAVRSVLAGASQQAANNTITSIVTQISGQPTDLRVNNTVATAGADDEEKDESLRDRARQFFTTARRGTLAAIRVAALGVPGVRTATAFEVIDVFGRPAKAVQLVVSDAFTDQLVNVNPTPATYQAQSQVLSTTVFNALEDVRAAGIFVDVSVAQVVLQGVTLGLRFLAGVNVDTVALKARAIVAATINSQRPGQAMTISSLISALQLITGLIVTGQEIISPAGDVVAEPLQVLRTSLSLVVASSLQPDQALQGSGNPDGVG